MDGMRDFGSYSRDPFNLDQVEIVKGPASFLGGRGFKLGEQFAGLIGSAVAGGGVAAARTLTVPDADTTFSFMSVQLTV